MPCVERYSEAWSFAAFWCYGNMISGAHEGAGPADATLSYSQGQFATKGTQANVGMVLYNLTQSTSGPVTAVMETSLTATDVTWENADIFRIVLITGIEISTIEHYLDVAASDIHAALAASGACDCTPASWANNYLAKLNIIDAAAYYSCPCGQPKFTSEKEAALLAWIGDQLTNLVTGRIEICAGETGADFPALGWAQVSVTDFNAARIIFNDMEAQS